VIALDTNVLARAILQDDEVQSPRAAKAIKELAAGEGALITMSVTLELAWVLRKRQHRAEVYETLHHLLESEGVTFVGAAIVGEALEIFRQGKIDFGDALLLAEASAHGVSKAMTFDNVLLKSDKRAVPVG
jgi:predicted nucleic-acid-binding protein